MQKSTILQSKKLYKIRLFFRYHKHFSPFSHVKKCISMINGSDKNYTQRKIKEDCRYNLLFCRFFLIILKKMSKFAEMTTLFSNFHSLESK